MIIKDSKNIIVDNNSIETAIYTEGTPLLSFFFYCLSLLLHFLFNLLVCMATGTNESEKLLDIREEGTIMKDFSNEKGFLFKKDENLADLL